MTLDEATLALLTQMVDGGVPSLAEMSTQEARQFVARMRPDAQSGPHMYAIKDRRVAVTGGAIPVRLLIPSEDPDGVIVYYHGGGWVLGSIDDSELLGRILARRANCVVVLVEYRLAPEYRFPTPVSDCYMALEWVEQHFEEFTARKVPLIVAGDSAGGNLAAVCTLKARDGKGPQVDLQILVYPVTDCDLDSASYREPENGLILTKELMAWFWDHYAPDPIGRAHPDASPLRAITTSNLPPAIVLTAEHDVLRSEGELYATRLMKSSVPVRHQRFKGQMHGFFTMVGVLPGSEAAMSYIVDELRLYLPVAHSHQSVIR